MKTHINPIITTSAWIAADCGEVLDIHEVNAIEINQSTDDGVFEDQDAWDAYEDSIIDNGIPESVIQFWDLELRKPEYTWVTRVGLDRYVGVNSDALEFEFSYELFVSRGGDKLTVTIEYYVKTTFKDS